MVVWWSGSVRMVVDRGKMESLRCFGDDRSVRLGFFGDDCCGLGVVFFVWF